MPRPVTLKEPDAHIVALQRTCSSVVRDSSYAFLRKARIVELLTAAIDELSQEQLSRVQKEVGKEESLEEAQDG
jgi:hypothetical protein